jgi:hypothetical protein
MKAESAAARKDPKNVFLMNQRRQQPIILPMQEIKKKMPETIGILGKEVNPEP